ncbi:hypothetical protein RHSIM_Rhsim05G0102800 [Rhododendron simsii]|uniref:DUF4283 domain-containing protein n=1 Tax=Rhododendron simsii TaxID=118357 RepID=A0A834GYK2_RHOSS|nr:hypothetical protein RHSIM_Rhsim05G0102800 [Rhododendron simsii]
MRTNKNCPKHGEDLETQVKGSDPVKASLRTNSMDHGGKTLTKKLISKGATKMALVEVLEDDKSIISDAETGNNKPVVKFKKIKFANKLKPEEVQVESHKPSTVINRPVETDREQPRKVIIKQPMVVINLDQSSQEVHPSLQNRKMKKIIDLSTFEKHSEKESKRSAEEVARRSNGEKSKRSGESQREREREREREQERETLNKRGHWKNRKASPSTSGDHHQQQKSPTPSNDATTGAITDHQALMEGLLPPCLVPEDPRVSVCSDRNVAFELLDGDLRKTYSHLQFECSDDSVAWQIKTLNAENLVLRQKAEDSFSRVLLDGNSSSLSSVPIGKPPSPTSWKDIVAPVNPLISRMNLHYCPPAVVNNDLHVNIRESVASAGVDRWKDWVVGYFVDRKLHFTAVKTISHKIWDQFGLLDVVSNEDGFFFFHFDKSGRYRRVIESGPWHSGGKLMVLKHWHPQMSLVKEQFFSFAESFGLSLPSGAKFTIRVWYPWKSLMCESCHVFGHRNCHPKPVNSKSVIPKQQVWVAKTIRETAPLFNHAASVSSSIVDDSAGVSAVVASVFSPAGVSDKGDPVLENPPKESVMVGTEVVFLPQPLCSSSGTMDGENMFSILQSDAGQAFLDPDGVLISLPTDEEFYEGLIVENSEIPSPKKKGRGRGKGAKKPGKGDIPAGSVPGKERVGKVFFLTIQSRCLELETKVRDSNISTKSCFPSHWLSVHNYSVGPVARIFLGGFPPLTLHGETAVDNNHASPSLSLILFLLYLSPHPSHHTSNKPLLASPPDSHAPINPNRHQKQQQQQKYKYETRYFVQCLDHFSFSDDLPTFRQQYLINAEHWVGPNRMGPIFLYCGNEGLLWERGGDCVVSREHRARVGTCPSILAPWSSSLK